MCTQKESIKVTKKQLREVGVHTLKKKKMFRVFQFFFCLVERAVKKRIISSFFHYLFTLA
jgi:hypothetical protein